MDSPSTVTSQRERFAASPSILPPRKPRRSHASPRVMNSARTFRGSVRPPRASWAAVARSTAAATTRSRGKYGLGTSPLPHPVIAATSAPRADSGLCLAGGETAREGAVLVALVMGATALRGGLPRVATARPAARTARPARRNPPRGLLLARPDSLLNNTRSSIYPTLSAATPSPRLIPDPLRTSATPGARRGPEPAAISARDTIAPQPARWPAIQRPYRHILDHRGSRDTETPTHPVETPAPPPCLLGGQGTGRSCELDSASRRC